MASFKKARVNSTAMATGAWIKVNPIYGDFELLIRGQSHEYYDRRNLLIRQAARAEGVSSVADYNNSAKQTQITADCIKTILLLDIRGMKDDDDPTGEKEITTDEFKAMLDQPDYQQTLILCCLDASSRVGVIADDGAKAAAVN